MRTNAKVYAAAFVLIIAAAFYMWIGPESGLYPRCFFHTLTGWECAGCGSQRMVHALLHLRFGEAFRANPFLLVTLPLLIPLAAVELNRKRWPGLYNRLHRPATIILIGIAVIAWWIGRNLI